MTGPSELEAIAGVNTTNDALRRALIGQDGLRLPSIDNTSQTLPPLNIAQHQHILLRNAHQKYCAENPAELQLMCHAGAGSILDALIDKYANSPLKLLVPQVIATLITVVHHQPAVWCTFLNVRMSYHIAMPALSSAWAHALKSYTSCVMPQLVHELLFVRHDAESHIVLGFVAGDTGASQARRAHCTCLTLLVPQD